MNSQPNDLSEFRLSLDNVGLAKYIGNAERVVVPENIKRIGYRAFSDSTTLKEIAFLNEVDIEKEAFRNCAVLERVEMHGGNIGDSAFEKCENLLSADLTGVRRIDAWAFSHCVNLEKVIVAPDVEIPYKPFYECPKLEALDLADGTKHPNSCAFLDRHEFDGCVCVRCGKTREWPEHTFVNGKCTKCGETEQAILDKRDALIRKLKSVDDWNERRDVAEALANYPYPDTVTALISILQRENEDQVVRFMCAKTLGKIGDKAAVEPLIEALEDGESNVVEYSAEALGILGDERAIEPLIRHLKPSGHKWGSNYSPVVACQQALGKFGTRATRRLLEILDNSAIYGDVIRALAFTGDIAAMPALITCARDSRVSDYYRIDAVKGLAKLDHPDSKSALLGLLETENNPALVEAIKQSVEELAMDASNSLATAEHRAKETLLNNLKALKVGMSQSDVEKLVGGGSFQMDTRIVYKTQYGDFQLIIANGILAEIPEALGPDGLIKKLEADLSSGI